MVKVEFTYFEIEEKNVTGVVITIIDQNGNTVSTYRNFNPSEYKIVHRNQSEYFETCSIELAKKFVESNSDYLEVKQVF